MHRPTVMVRAGLMLEARTISALSPVARTERPRRVPINHFMASAARTATVPSTASLYQSPTTGRRYCLARSKMVTALFMFTLLAKPPLLPRPITARLTV